MPALTSAAAPGEPGPPRTELQELEMKSQQTADKVINDNDK